ncbi:MAG TPA: class B sortase [Candidatus Acetatifactor stercoripullorum]|uniref:Class B sortase n=1 Tax=Candidatus Acetatifactor stercoripullorum TaxID=2838414 RepID=A0A9D1R3V4_9FIRM|nr:class B sortase [Candidatus Acetatifactor stercoripullorum]HIW80500.1 class B sortase [Candidatus Acetatifactor stercoripullorum]
MTQKTYIVEGRQFRTETDYRRAVHDRELIERLRAEAAGYDKKKLEQLYSDIKNGKYNFFTLLGQDFADEVEELLRKKTAKGGGQRKNAGSEKGKGRGKESRKRAGTKKSTKKNDQKLEAFVREELKKREKRRRLMIVGCLAVAAGCIGYFCLYSYYDYRTRAAYSELSALKEKPAPASADESPVIHYTLDGETQAREVLDEYKNLLNKNKKLIGWIKIDDTNIDYPVMQTSDNEYYLDHNLNQEYDKNGSIFMDKDCDVLKPSTNLIIYGHHMKNGQMFGDLDLYSSEEYFKEHRYIQFDTIYEKGVWEVMYVFRSRVYSEEEIVFKYYQFIDALSEQEFNSNMQEMAAMSLYDTGVTAQYGDRLLTLSTCDYQETDGRFVVVAKKSQ